MLLALSMPENLDLAVLFVFFSFHMIYNVLGERALSRVFPLDMSYFPKNQKFWSLSFQTRSAS